MSAAQTPQPTLAPDNPAFIQYLQNPYLVQALSAPEHPAGLVPETIDLTYAKPARVTVADVAGALPSSYDLRTLNKLTPIRDQGSCGDCWAFATMGSLESSLMPTESWDFSENNLKDLAGFDLSCCSGGNRTMSTAYLARWGGAIAESDDPYKAGSCTSPAGLSPKKHVQEVIYVPNRTSALDNDAIKQAVMAYGAVYTTYYHSDSYYNSSTASYYYNGSSQANHAVCIVGWDDNYSASNFLTPPPGNGAFLIRNSWGTYWGKSGYFWMSYYDATLGKMENAVFRAEPATNYNGIYQYDPLGWVSSTGFNSNTAWFANVFTATANSSIAAASWYTAAPNSAYELDVYLNPTNGPINSAGANITITGTIPAAGYHTIALPTTVAVTTGQRFSVVVKLTTPGYNYPIPMERPYSGYSSAATAGTGQSYISNDGANWADMTTYYTGSNCCLKAFTSPNSAPAPGPGVLSVTPSTGLSSAGNTGGPFNPTSQTYTLTNTGQSSISWTASGSQNWMTVSPTSGTLAPNVSAAVTVSINSTANTLAAGTYSDTATFTNTTNGSGNAVRSVDLTISAPTPPPTPTPGALSVTPTTGLTASGNAGGPFSPASQAYTLTNTGQSSINWTASATKSWVSLSSSGGTLPAGGSAVVTVSINSSASTLAAGTYTDNILFTNTTNGTGNTARGVTLNVNAVAPPPNPTPGAYSMAPTTFNWIDPTYMGSITLYNDAVSAMQYMPFIFTFYGKTYYRIYVGSNGLLSFSNSNVASPYNTDIPSPSWPNAAIYPYWANLNPQMGGSVRYGMAGSAPNRRLVITWMNVPSAYYPYSKLTFQAILCEGTNDIIFQYLNVAPTDAIYGAGANATIGIENETGSQACKFSYKTRSLTNNMAIRFTALPTTIRTGRFGRTR